MNDPKPIRIFAKTVPLLVLLAILLTLVLLKIQTYVCAQDSSLIYIRLARDMVSADWSPASIGAVMHYLAPGYPLLLAASMDLLGAFAPYWLNLGFAILFFALLGYLVQAYTGKVLHTSLCLLWLFLMLIAGHPQNMHFMLYAFRDMPALTLLLAATLCLLHGQSVRAGLLAGFLGICCAALREPTALALLGPLLWVLVQKKKAVWMPFLLMMLAATVFIAVFTGFQGNDQWQRLLPMLFSKGRTVAESYSFWSGSNLFGLGLIDQIGWVGIILGFIASIQLVRKPKGLSVLYGLLLPAVILFLFYSAIRLHPRYVLTVLLLIGVLPGLGLCWTLDWLSHRVENQRFSLFLALLILGSIFTAIGIKISQLEPWGPKVSRAEVSRFVADINQRASPGDQIFMEDGCRMLAAVLSGYTDLEARGKNDPVHLDGGYKVFYAEALNEAAYDSRTAIDSGMRTVEAISRTYDVPTRWARQRLSKQFTFAGGQFSLVPVTSRIDTGRHISFGDQVDLPNDFILWLDLRMTREDNPLRFDIVTREGELLHQFETSRGQGIVPLYIPARWLAEGAYAVSLVSEEPLPKDCLLKIRKPGQFLKLSFGNLRRFSSLLWFGEGFEFGGFHSKYPIRFSKGGSIHLPRPLGGAAGDILELGIQLAFSAEAPDASVHFYMDGTEVIPVKQEIHGQKIGFALELPLIKSALSADLELRVVDPSGRTEQHPLIVRSIYLATGPHD